MSEKFKIVLYKDKQTWSGPYALLEVPSNIALKYLRASVTVEDVPRKIQEDLRKPSSKRELYTLPRGDQTAIRDAFNKSCKIVETVRYNLVCVPFSFEVFACPIVILHRLMWTIMSRNRA
ncbi:hypothetical protein V8E52_007184 [Russula decolorans]